MHRYILALLFACTTAQAGDCDKDGKYHWTTCYGLQHGLIAAGVVGATTYIEPRATVPVAVGTCAAFIAHELNGEGDLFASADRIGDWVVPCAVAAGITYHYRDTTIAPWVSDDTVGVFYNHTFK